MVGLGLVLAQPAHRVLVVTGDGEMLMGLGALATIGVQRPQNLAIAVFDNGRYGETGVQTRHTDAAVSLPAVARVCGIEQAFDIANEPALREFSRLMYARDRPSSRTSRSPQPTRRACCRHGTVPYSVNGGLHDAVRSRQPVFAGNLAFSQSYLMAKALRGDHQQAGLDGRGT
jgi:hypothetical protein